MLLHTDAFDAVAVADGMGGHNAGEVASLTAVETMQRVLSSGGEDWEFLLHEAEKAANEAVHTLASTDDAMYGMGCTLVAAVFDRNSFVAANVGDSRLYHFDGKTLKQITHDHSFVAELVRRGAITAEEARTHPRNNLITRAIGTEMNVPVDLFSCEWKAGDMLLLCSDGLCGVLHDEEMAKHLCDCDDLDAACDALIRHALASGSRDNITVVLVKNDGGDA
ncbi:MAG: Stp1/IreP family PP2C-type Ser/Thr phosphatase [Clostridia bacterium]|nr:Stp1/IreP family PP2C-type Ser/Thr phosphatase [Clostridia bacterium]